jgi:alkylhydroperoxidase/carboxymuconolactone decarboxylase family protein YurZ
MNNRHAAHVQRMVDAVLSRPGETDPSLRRAIEALRNAGYSEEAIFEMTLSAAIGAGQARLERGLAALKGVQDAAQEA